MECTSGVIKQFKIEKRKVELKEKKLDKVRLREDVPGANYFTSRETRRMQIRVLSEFNFKLAF